LSVTPAPWSNIMANPKFGAMVTEAGGGYCWSGNSQSNKLTPWSNDPVSDTIGEAIYIRDEDSGTFWTPTSLPIRELDPYRTRHGAGYSIFEHNSHAIEQELIAFVPVSGEQSTLGVESAPLRVQRLRLRNRSSRRRRLTVTAYSELIMGTTREETQPHVVTAWDTQSKVLLARNAYHPDYGHRMAFASSSPAPRSHGGDRTSFLGRNGSPSSPAAMRRKHLSNRCGAAIDACAALQVFVEIEPHGETEVTFVLGQTDGVDEARALVERFRDPAEVERALRETQAWWDKLLGTVEVETPILSVNFLLNRWLPYQTLSCRLWGRSAFYQSGGAFGFRDQLQDVMGMVYALPEITRAQILRAAAHQFPEGDVQHWWHEPSNAGVRTRISDDLLFLPYVVAHYIRVTGDATILDEEVPFLSGRLLEEDEHETYLPAEASTESGTIFEHCRRAIEKGCTRGPHDLPLIGAGDWNDGMNRVGIEGRGESVWLAWFAIDVLNQFAELCAQRKQSTLIQQYRARAKAYAQAIEAHAWDGEWYLRAFFDDGAPLGSHTSDEAKIDALPQSWSVLSGAGDPVRREQALQSLETHLVKRDDKMILLFTPAFDKTETDPGYIKGYLPGVRENGGQYTHAAIWSAMSFARAGHGTKAVDLLKMLNPVEHAREPQDVAKYKVEPYVVAADIYALENQVGRGGWTWYTGSASWMYRAWIEEVLGFQLRGNQLSLDPSIPTNWPGFTLRYRYGSTLYVLEVQNPGGVESGVLWLEFDGKRLRTKVLSLIDDGTEHHVVVRMGHAEKKVNLKGMG
ncbi:MAG: cyclic beta,2-glucan synthetase, partial [Abditibacteriota bacterium]|nr:cyclic beta,2-glucan synthetase [Abditibacteriota bacterium]